MADRLQELDKRVAAMFNGALTDRVILARCRHVMREIGSLEDEFNSILAPYRRPDVA